MTAEIVCQVLALSLLWIIDTMSAQPVVSLTGDFDSSPLQKSSYSLQLDGALSPADAAFHSSATNLESFRQLLAGAGGAAADSGGILRSLDHSGTSPWIGDLGVSRAGLSFSLPSSVDNSVRELVVIDPGVEDWETLVHDLRVQQRAGRSLDVLLLDASQDGVSQISRALSSYRGLSTVHIISHGVADGVQLGNEWLRSGNLAAHAGALLGWRDALATEADILLYGCNLAANADGQTLVDGIALLTGADVAASRNLTGFSPKGGDWSLEYTAGQIDSSVIVTEETQANWKWVLNGTINIDQAWLTAQGGAGNYILNQTNTTYVLQTDVNVTGTAFYIANTNITFDLNGRTINYGSASQANKWGVCLYLSWHNTEIVIPGAKEATGFTLKNGSIINQGNGDLTHAIYGNRGQGATLENLYVETKGKDSFSVAFTNGDANIRHNVLITHTDQTFNRHQGPANVKIGGALQASHNLLIGGNSGFVSGTNSVIEKNVISHSGFATNGYAGWFYRVNNVVMRDNIIIPTNGRGILANAGENHVYENNTILHLELPNQEFGTALNPPAVRSRYDAKNIVYRNNTSLGIGGGELTSASSIYLTNDGAGVNQFVDNQATVILKGTPSSNRYAQPLTMEGQGTYGSTAKPSQDVISGNVFKSNHYMIRTSGYDGYTRQEAPISNNAYHWTDGNSASSEFRSVLLAKWGGLSPEFSVSVRTAATAKINAAIATIDAHLKDVALQADRAFWFGKHSSFVDAAGSYATILNSTFGNGVDPRTVAFTTTNQGAVTLREGNSHRIRFVSQGVPLANQTITINSDAGDQFQAVTDLEGFADISLINFALVKADPTGSPFILNGRTKSTLTLQSFDPVDVFHNNVPSVIDVGEQAPPHRLEYQGTQLSVWGTDLDNEFSWRGSTPTELVIDGYYYSIRPDTTQITFYAGLGNDLFNLQGTSGNDQLGISPGEFSFTSSLGLVMNAMSFENVVASGGGGSDDRAFLNDSAGDDQFSASAGQSTMEGQGYRHQVSGFQRVVANRSTGNDSAQFQDSVGNDSLIGRRDFTSLVTGGVVNRANWFPTVVATSNAGGIDVARLYDTSGTESISGGFESMQLQGQDYSLVANRFHRLYAYGTASGSRDQMTLHGLDANHVILHPRQAIMRQGTRFIEAAGFPEITVEGGASSTALVRMFGGTGTDQFEGFATHSTLAGSNYVNRVNAFPYVVSFASAGGDDRARLFDSGGDDTFSVYPDWALFLGQGYAYKIFSFSDVTAYSSGGTTGDVARFYPGNGADEFEAQPTQATLSRPGFVYRSQNFSRNVAYAGGLENVARLIDSSGNDTLTGDLRNLQLFGQGYSSVVDGFRKVFVWADNGGANQLSLADSAGNDTFRVRPGWTTIAGSGVEVTASGFFNQMVRSVRGGSDSVVLEAVGSSNTANMYELFTSMTNSARTYFQRVDGFQDVLVESDGTGTDNRVYQFVPSSLVPQWLHFYDRFGFNEVGGRQRRFYGFDQAFVQRRAGLDNLNLEELAYQLELISV